MPDLGDLSDACTVLKAPLHRSSYNIPLPAARGPHKRIIGPEYPIGNLFAFCEVQTTRCALGETPLGQEPNIIHFSIHYCAMARHQLCLENLDLFSCDLAPVYIRQCPTCQAMLLHVRQYLYMSGQALHFWVGGSASELGRIPAVESVGQ